MEVFLKPFVMGLLIAGTALLGLWLAIPILGSLFGDSWFSWYPVLVLLPSLVLGGYTSACYMRTKYLSRYLIMGGVVGVVAMAIIHFLTHVEGKGWFSALLIAAGGSISVFGAYLGARRNHRV